MNYTENLSLGLPEYGEDADVADLNRNSGILDAYCYNTRQIECEPYDSTKTYMSGDLAIHNEVIYECNTDNTTGTWDDSKWDSTTLAEQIAKAKQMGGESALADLEDVNLTNPSKGQIITYDDTNDKWVNTDNTAVTKTVSGNPVEFTDGADAPLVKCETAITGSQDLHGYDKPWVGGAGVNKFPDSSEETKTSHSVTVISDGNGMYSINGTESSEITAYFIFDLSEPITATNNQKLYIGGTYIGTVSFLNNVGARVEYWSKGSSDGRLINNPGNLVGNSVTRLRLEVGASTSHSNETLYILLIDNAITDYSFSPWKNICPITAYTEGEIEVVGRNLFNANGFVSTYSSNYQIASDGSVETTSSLLVNQKLWDNVNNYGGHLSISYKYKYANAGSVGIRLKINYADGTSETVSTTNSQTYNTITKTTIKKVDNIVTDYGSGSNTTNFFLMVVMGDSPYDYEPYKGTTHTTTYPSAIYRGSEDVVNGEVTTEWGMIASYAGETLPGEWISDRDEYAPGTTPTTGAQVAYELATPTTSSVTPTNLPIRTLSGYNHIESSTGDMEVEYITSEYQPLVDLIQSSNGHTYSTQEQVVGKWIDGRSIYERTFVVPNFSASSVAGGTFYEGVLDLSTEFADAERSWGYVEASYIKLADTSTRIVNFVDTQNPKRPSVQFLGAPRTGTLTLTMQYLKTTVQTRSLNAPLTSQRAQIEPLTDKTEEVPTEEEKAVNEEENTNENR